MTFSVQFQNPTQPLMPARNPVPAEQPRPPVMAMLHLTVQQQSLLSRIQMQIKALAAMAKRSPEQERILRTLIEAQNKILAQGRAQALQQQQQIQQPQQQPQMLNVNTLSQQPSTASSSNQGRRFSTTS